MINHIGQCREILSFMGYGRKYSAHLCLSLMAISTIALLIIGSVGAAGAIPGSVPLGWISCGLAGTVFLSNLIIGGFNGTRRCEPVIVGLASVVLAVVGILGGLGILSPIQVGWAIIGTVPTAVLLNGPQCYSRYKDAKWEMGFS